MRLPSLKLLLTFFLLSFYSFVAAQYTIPQKPTLLYPVYDEANLLTQQEKESLNNKLIKFADSTSTEIEVIIIPTTKGEDINYVATMFGEKWGIGKKDVDNGIVFLIAKDDHTMSIQQGRAVEQYLTASVTGQILDYLVTPKFKQGKWYEGINDGTDALMEAVQGKFKPLVNKQSNEDNSALKIVIIAFIIFILLAVIFGNKGGGRGNDDDDDVIISRRGRRNYPGGFFPFPGSFGGGSFGGGFGGGSSGGGFGGFGGGGSFGGGGASGGW